ncbi:MAG: alpha/beta fold hydrolase [Alphaproteobacteria bacterium]|nr:alpha/beta fold hydrolase [Alphaproteobacteria bacterium]
MPEVIINGPEGRIEGRYTPARTPNAPIALMLHPHPQRGGTMNNRVVYALHQLYTRRGFATLRFNFRGVGRSQGFFDRGEGELSDAASALDWLQSTNPDAPAVWIAGYSFGAWIGMQLLMRRPEISGFISVSPPANLFDFTFLAPCPASGLIVHGARDNLVPKQSVETLIEKVAKQKDVVIDLKLIADADHFFADQLDQIRRAVDAYMDWRSSPIKGGAPARRASAAAAR